MQLGNEGKTLVEGKNDRHAICVLQYLPRKFGDMFFIFDFG